MNFKLWLETDEQSFINALKANPKDTNAWLVFADYLEERGDRRGELIRVLADPKQQTAPNLRQVSPIMQTVDANFATLLSEFPLVRIVTSFESGLINLAQATQIQKVISRPPKRLQPPEFNDIMGKMNKILKGKGLDSIYGSYERDDEVSGIYVIRNGINDNTIIYDLETGEFEIATYYDWIHDRGLEIDAEPPGGY